MSETVQPEERLEQKYTGGGGWDSVTASRDAFQLYILVTSASALGRVVLGPVEGQGFPDGLATMSQQWFRTVALWRDSGVDSNHHS